MPRLATTWAPCQLSVRTRSLRAKTPPARPCAEERDRLCVEVAGADNPVERVLHHASDRAGVLRRGDQHGVGGADLGAKVQHRVAGVIAAIGVQRWNRPEAFERADLHAPRRQRRASDVERGPVRRAPLQAAANEEDSNHRDTIGAGLSPQQRVHAAVNRSPLTLACASHGSTTSRPSKTRDARASALPGMGLESLQGRKMCSA